MKSKLWIVSFQCLSNSKENQENPGIRCMATCTAAKSIDDALNNAKYLIRKYLSSERLVDRYAITDVGIAAEDSRELLDLFWSDSLQDPDPELFM